MGTHPIFESDFDCLTDKKMFGQNQYQQNQQQMNQQMNQPGVQQAGPNQQMPQQGMPPNAAAMQSQQQQAMQQGAPLGAPRPQNMPQQQQPVMEIDDPVIQIKKMVPKLKDSLNSVMTISSKVLEFNCRVDHTASDQSRPPTSDQ